MYSLQLSNVCGLNRYIHKISRPIYPHQRLKLLICVNINNKKYTL